VQASQDVVAVLRHLAQAADHPPPANHHRGDASHPALARQVAASGHEVGVHGFRHEHLTELGFTIAIGVLLDSLPNFRVWSLGTPGITINPDDINGDQNARCAIGDTATANGQIGDNSRYFTVLDYVKTTSRINSPWVAVATTTGTMAEARGFPSPAGAAAGRA
jgi:hypothetical protein